MSRTHQTPPDQPDNQISPKLDISHLDLLIPTLPCIFDQTTIADISPLWTSDYYRWWPSLLEIETILISVVPQPVYMNMSDLERLRQQKLHQQELDEDGLDLKTPTQEDLDNLPSSSDGSSSGYGSQNLASEQVYGDGKFPVLSWLCWPPANSWTSLLCCPVYTFLKLFCFSLCCDNRRAHIEICSLSYTNKTSYELTTRYSARPKY